MRHAFDRSTQWIVNRPWITTLLIVMITAVASLGYRDPDVFRRMMVRAQVPAEEDVSSNRDNEMALPNVNPVNVTRADAILVVQSDSFFTPTGAEAMRAVVERLEQLDYVDNVLWMDRVPILNIFGLPEPLFPRAQASPHRFQAAREKALSHPLVKGQLLSPDGQTMLLMVRFDWLFVHNDDDCIERLQRVARDAAAEYPGIEIDFSVTGSVPLRLTAMKQHESNQLKYQLIGYGMIALMAIVLFRGITAVVVVALAPALGVFWTLGMLRFFDLHDNPFNDVVLPVLLSLVGLTDGVHLIVQIRRLRVSGMAEQEAARAGIREVGLACLLTSVTTAIGFGSLSLAHHEVVREFGWSCVIGVLLTFVAVITVIPLACSTWLGRRVHIGYEKSLIDKHLNRISGLIDIVLRNPRRWAMAGIVATIVCTIISLLVLRPDERNANALPDNCEPLIALRKMDKALGGLEVSNVEVTWTSAVESDSAEVLTVIADIDDFLRSEPLIGHPLSIRNLLDALPGEGSPADRMSMLDLLPPPLKRAFYTPERRHAIVRFRVQDLGIAKYGPVFQRIEAELTRMTQRHPAFTLQLAGSAFWRWENLYQIVVDLAASLGSAAFIIFLVLTLAYRSIRIGLISLVPNLFPLAVTGTYLAFTGQALEIVSVCAFTICLGIAVDDTIHFLTRFQEEQIRSDDPDVAIRRAFTGVGTALIMTTVILVSGFATVVFSGLRDHRIFAAMGGLTLTAALFGDLVFLPALLRCYAPHPPSTSSSSDSGEETQ